MTGPQAAREVAQLSGSTLATIVGSNRYEEIDRELDIMCTTIRLSTRQFDTWIDAVEWYKRAHVPAYELPVHNDY